MASQLGCDDSKPFAAVAPVSGLRFPSPCPLARQMQVVSFDGTADPVDPYGGDGQEYRTYSVPVAAMRWAAADRCKSKPGTSKPAATVKLTASTGVQGRCRGRALHPDGGGPRAAGQAACPEGGHRAARAAVGRGRRRHRDVEVLLPPRARLRPDGQTANSGGRDADRDKRPAGACARAARGLSER